MIDVINALLINIYVWIGLGILLLITNILSIVLLIVLSMKTHAMIELRAWMQGYPIAMFFQENRYVVWKAIKPDANIVVDPDFGAFLINDKGSYVDALTKNVFLPFDSTYGASINIKAAKLADDLSYVVTDEQDMRQLRSQIANNQIADNETIDSIKTSINFGSLKNMITALTPHNINAKIEKTVAKELAGKSRVNVANAIVLFVSIFGAILLGALVLYLTLR